MARLTRAEQRYNYVLAIGAVLVIAVLIVLSPQVSLSGERVPVLVVAVLAGAFLFGLGQMLLGIFRRRRYIRSLQDRAGE
jgi:hypothetical protein